MPEIILEVEALKKELLTSPKKALIFEACWVMELYPREDLPDWVEILANGNPECWESVMEVAKEDLQADEVAE